MSGRGKRRLFMGFRVTVEICNCPQAMKLELRSCRFLMDSRRMMLANADQKLRHRERPSLTSPNATRCSFAMSMLSSCVSMIPLKLRSQLHSTSDGSLPRCLAPRTHGNFTSRLFLDCSRAFLQRDRIPQNQNAKRVTHVICQYYRSRFSFTKLISLERLSTVHL